jgi:N-acetylmuramoyl-L-alanine amidase
MPEIDRRRLLGTMALGAAAAGASSCTPESHGSTSSRPTPSATTPPSSERPRGEPTPTAATPRPSGDLTGKVICVDPGHNGDNEYHPSVINKPVDIITKVSTCDTVGAETNDGYPEHAFNWDVAIRLRRLLEARGARVVFTRPNDHGVGPCINQRAAIGNRARADAAISIHADGAPADGHGFHIITPLPVAGHNSRIVPASARLGLALRDAYHQATGIPYSSYAGHNAINPRDDLGGLNFSLVPKVFIECANMRNAGDARILTDADRRQAMATGLAMGFAAFLRA